MRKFIYLIVGFFLLIGLSNAQNIAYVDVQKVMNLSEKGKKLKAEIQEKVKYYQKKLDDIDKKIAEIKKQLESPVLSEEAKEKKRKELADLQEKGQKIQQEAEEELSKMKAKAERELVLEIQKVAKKFAEENNIDLIFVGGAIGGVVYFDNSIDVTDKILNMFNREAK